MDKVRKLIKETLENSTLFEGAKTFMDIPPSAGVMVKKVSGSLTDISLFDFSKKECIGNISITKISDKAYAVNTAAAKDNFGPLMYEIAMMHVYPASLCSDRGGNTTADALKVWKKFYDLRGDIKKQKLQAGEPEFKDRFENDENNYMLNYLYSRPKSNWFLKAVERGIRLKQDTQLQDNSIFDVCSAFFKSKYSTR